LTADAIANAIPAEAQQNKSAVRNDDGVQAAGELS